jgi:hypothetical protein
MPRCPNCSADLDNEFCATCGQQRIHPDDLSARHFVQELIDEVTTLRAHFKTLHSLRALLTPGYLTAEFLAGRRRPYLSPIKVYLVCAAVFFLAASLGGFTLASLIEDDRSGTLRRLVSARQVERGLAPELFRAQFDLRLQSVYTIGMGAGGIAFALGLEVLFFTKRMPFGAHVIFACHYVSFLYLLTIAAGASRRLGVSTELAAGLALCLIAPYLFLALKRVYHETSRAIVLKAGGMFALTLVVNNVTSRLAILLTLALV